MVHSDSSLLPSRAAKFRSLIERDGLDKRSMMGVSRHLRRIHKTNSELFTNVSFTLRFEHIKFLRDCKEERGKWTSIIPSGSVGKEITIRQFLYYYYCMTNIYNEVYRYYCHV